MSRLDMTERDDAAEACAQELLELQPSRCDPCRGSGRWGRGTLNGKLIGAGPCFRCGGKGVQTAADRARNAAYDRYTFGVAARAMTRAIDQDDDQD